jgi:hypothetical protein
MTAAATPASGTCATDEREADQDRLDHRNSNDAERDGPDRLRGKIREFRGALRTDDADEDGAAPAIADSPNAMTIAPMMNAAMSCSKRDADARDEAERAPGDVADLGLQALDQPRQVGMRLPPQLMDLFADDRPRGNARPRLRDLEGVVANILYQLLDRIAEQAHEHGRRRDDQHRAEDQDQRRRESLPISQLACDDLVKRIERDGEDDRPDRQVQEWREHLIAEHDQCRDQTCADQNLQQGGFQSLLELRVGTVHRSSPKWRRKGTKYYKDDDLI